jgi:hypothetical protein
MCLAGGRAEPTSTASIAESRRRKNPRIDTYFADLDDCGPMVLTH